MTSTVANQINNSVAAKLANNAGKLTSAQSSFLDLARGLAAQAVLFGHVISYNGIKTEAEIQKLGVVIFFLLSGFLITWSYLRKDSSYDFIDFLIDRAARIFVPYLPAILFIVALGLAFNMAGPYDISTIIGNIFLLQNFPFPVHDFLKIDMVGTGRPLWSISVEWWLYMGFAGLVFFGRVPRWAFPLVLIAIFFISAQLIDGMLVYIWLFGSLIAVCWERLNRSHVYFWIFVAGFSLFFHIYRLRLAGWDFYDLQAGLLIGIAFFSLLKAFQNFQMPVWVNKISCAVAAISYSLYLTHYTIMQAIPGWSTILFANIFAILMWFLFERHHPSVSRWLRSFRRGRDCG